MSAAEQSVLPTSVLAPKTMAVRRAAIFLAFLQRWRLWCREATAGWRSVQALLRGYLCRLRQDTQAVLLRMHTLYSFGSSCRCMALLSVSRARDPSIGVR